MTQAVCVYLPIVTIPYGIKLYFLRHQHSKSKAGAQFYKHNEMAQETRESHGFSKSFLHFI